MVMISASHADSVLEILRDAASRPKAIAMTLQHRDLPHTIERYSIRKVLIVKVSSSTIQSVVIPRA